MVPGCVSDYARAMPNMELQITIFPTSNIVADASTNTWSVVTGAGDFGTLFKDSVLVFYQAIAAMYPVIIRQNNHVWKLYDRSDPEPRAPKSMGTFNFSAAPSIGPAPPEVAMCLSFQAPQQSGVPQARQRGRVYIGPLRASLIDGAGRPTTASITLLRNAGEALRVASAAAATWDWVVWSTVQGTAAGITNGWVDDEFDTQRRRGRVPTVRNVFP